MRKHNHQNPIKVSLLKNEDLISKSRYFVLLNNGALSNALAFLQAQNIYSP